MLQHYSEVFRTLMIGADLLLVSAAWLCAYYLRFHMGLPTPLGVPEFDAYLQPLVVIVPVWFLLFRSHGLYETQRTSSPLLEVGRVIRATGAGILVLVAITFFARSYFYSRGVIAAFAVLSPVLVLGLRLTLRLGLRQLRRRGYNLRNVVIVGGGRLAEETIGRIRQHRETGLRILGVLTDQGGHETRRVAGVPVIAGYGGLPAVLEEHSVDQVVIALSREEGDHLEKVLADLEDQLVSVKLIPDLLHVMTLRSSVEDLDGLPLIHLRESPLIGWAAVQKRLFDLVGSSVGLVVASPLFLAIGLIIVATSGRPVFYSQRRMGFDGRVFRMHKFRSMNEGAEEESGPVWARPDDPRRTRFGALIRRISLDELPQLWNVLKGDMSLVGPRPERPALIEGFRREIPGYMLRHKVKAGCTGWAQVHGWRGNTSLHERVEHDIYYIQNWSLALDFQILLMTAWRGLFERNAY